MTVKELTESIEDCMFQVVKYNKDTDEYEIVCDIYTPIPPTIGKKKVITATPSFGQDKNGKEKTVIELRI